MYVLLLTALEIEPQSGDLVTSPPDLMLLRRYIDDYTSLTRTLLQGGQCPFTFCRSADRWMGGGRPTNGTWAWLSGATSIPWRSPWPRLDIRGRACLVLSPWDGTYKDSHCDERHPYICKPQTLTELTDIASATPSLATTTIATSSITSLPHSTSQSSTSNMICGLSQSVDERIHSGREAISGEYPWMVHISYFSNILDNLVPCGGSLIAARWVLTAAYCFKHLKSNVDVILKLGFVDRTRNAPGAAIFVVTDQNIIQHSQFRPQTLENDIALILLPEKVSFNHVIQPICLGSDDHIPFGGTATVAGWGLLNPEDTGIPRILNDVELNVVREDSCKDKQFFICTFTPGKDICQGDSGGPLMIKENGRWYQVGIVSDRPLDCGNKTSPIVYTRVPNYLPFIWSNIRF